MISAQALIASIPSPSQSSWSIGPFSIKAYALCILTGIFVAIWLTKKRWAERGQNPEDVYNIAFWAVIFGVIGGRLYHVISSPRAYFGEGGNPIKAFYIWEGGLGIWGAIALGAVGVFIGCRRAKVSFPLFADAVAPALLIAQGIGRLGNWFNQELFGGATTLPWGLKISPENFPTDPIFPPGTLFHPTFLYELLWNFAAAGLLLYLDRKKDFKTGQLFWLYVLFYTIGRLWVEMLRIDPAEHIFGLRLNVWTSIIVIAGAIIAFIIVGRKKLKRDNDAISHEIELAEDDVESAS